MLHRGAIWRSSIDSKSVHSFACGMAPSCAARVSFSDQTFRGSETRVTSWSSWVRIPSSAWRMIPLPVFLLGFFHSGESPPVFKFRGSERRDTSSPSHGEVRQTSTVIHPTGRSAGPRAAWSQFAPDATARASSVTARLSPLFFGAVQLFSIFSAILFNFDTRWKARATTLGQ